MSDERFAAVTPSPMDSIKLAPPSPYLARGMEATVDHIRVMLFQERELYPVCRDYLSSYGDVAKDIDRVNEGWRRKLCEWTFEVVDHFGFDREVVSIALDYLDRTTSLTTKSMGKAMPKREFQLVAVASLYLAIKLHGEVDAAPDGTRIKLKISSFQELSRGFFKVETIETTERAILSALNWRVNPPVAVQFVAFFLRLVPEWPSQKRCHSHETVVSRIYDLAKYFTELSACVSSFAFKFKPSVVAYACILYAMEALGESSELPYAVRVQFLKNVAGTCSELLPGMEDVVLARSMIKNLCSSAFETEDNPPSELPSSVGTVSPIGRNLDEESGKVSPVCVCSCDDGRPHPRHSKRVRRDQSTDTSSTSSIPQDDNFIP